MKRSSMLALCMATAVHAPVVVQSATAASASAQDPTLQGQRLAATCANCHGTTGNPVDQSFAPLAGMPAATLTASMQAFREGSRPSTVMQQLAKGFSDAQVKLIADYYAGQKNQSKREAQ